MEIDFLVGLEYLGVTARIKRLSDTFFYSIKELYKQLGITIEPSWHLVFLILKDQKKISMFDLAKRLHLSRPAITKMIKKMAELDYVLIASDQSDSRKKMVVLSEKAQNNLVTFERVWNAGQLAVQAMLQDNPHFLSCLEKLEKQQREFSFDERTLQIYHSAGL
ncbi:MAG: MarR family transcriptional regulator [Saprospiraceae bacterium]|nr:MarR family transcriptional regulator [Saprospiraceae bacterium]HPG06416.1 MarR family transcriptional regulator [Saprospiraceae bacterium]HQU54961.1 MarR family transcriptional regulator [Saprospiraceae bacterium]